MLALYRSGRQTDALAEFARARELLVGELGVEPGAALRQLQRSILEQDESVAAPAAPSSLPVPPSPLIGRARELAEAAELVRGGARVVTLTGPGGIGKTRLALELARTLEPEFAHGAALVRLATTLSPSLVPDAIAQAVGVPDATAELLREHLRRRELLLLLDNFEQLLPAAGFLAELLEAAPGLRLLVTSRAVLRIDGEHEFPVPPLGEAEELFAARARAVEPSFAGDEDVVAAICARLDRLPLAIELAAARVKLLSPSAILERLEHSLDLLTGGRADALAHHQTLRAAIDWSYRLLDPEEQQLFVRLGVFSGGATLEAVEDVCGGDLDGLASLVDKSLLRRYGDRFGMLELLREYAAEQLDDSVRRAHLDWYLALAEGSAVETARRVSAAWLDRLEDEHDNLRVALAFAVEHGDADAATRLAGSLTRFWLTHGHLREGARWFEAVLAVEGGAPPLARQQCETGLGIMRAEQGDLEGAEEAFTRAAELARGLGDDTRTASALSNLGNLAVFRRDHDRARALFTEAAALHEGAGNRRGHAIAVENLGVVAFREGDLESAERLLGEAVSRAREIEDRVEEASALRALARVRLDRGGPDAAAATLAEALPPIREVGDRHGVAEALEVAAAVAAARGDGERAAELLGAADATREAIGARMLPDLADWYGHAVEAARALVPPAAFEAARERGRRLDPDDALDNVS
jgi:predicted ATPase